MITCGPDHPVLTRGCLLAIVAFLILASVFMCGWSVNIVDAQTQCPGSPFFIELLFAPSLNIRALPGGAIAGNPVIDTFDVVDGQVEADNVRVVGADTYFHIKGKGWVWNQRLSIVCGTSTPTRTPTRTPSPTRGVTPSATPTSITTVQATPGWWITFWGVSTFCMDPCRPEFSRELPTRSTPLRPATVTPLP